MVTVDPDKLVMLVIGLIVSMIAYFIKKESNKLTKLGEAVRKLQIDLTKNECKDSEGPRVGSSSATQPTAPG